MLSEINEWLSNPARLYGQGMQLYLQHGSNEFYKKMFLRGETPLTRSTLIEQLKKMVPAQVKPQAVPSPPPARLSELKVTVPKRQDLPEELQKADVKKGQLFREASMCHRKLTMVSTDQERFALAQTILNKFDQIDEIWQQIDDYQNGVVKQPVPEVVITDPMKLLVRLQNIKSYIRRAVSRGTDPEQVKAWKAEAAAIEEKLKEHERTIG